MNISETAQEKKARIIHSLSFASNSGFGKIFKDETTCQGSYEKLQNYVTTVSDKVLSDKRTQKYIGNDWETVWGPVVYSHDKNSSYARADNTMAVYYSKTEKLFVIAIAGTNSISSFGWMKEDFHVNKTAVWKDISGKGMGDISQGTATGLNILVHTMKDRQLGVLTALKDYIIDKKISKVEVAVTGHSLGGALSPALALYLSDKRTEWNNGQDIQISTYPTAGPTIGVYPNWKNRRKNNFIKYYNDQIKAGNIKYHATINDLDIVPLAWDKDDLAKIPQLYTNFGIQDVSFGTMSLIVVLNTFKNSDKLAEKLKQYVYKHISPTVVSGEFYDVYDKKIIKLFNRLKPGTYITNKYIPKPLQANIKNAENLFRFFAQAAYQHTTAYDVLLGIKPFMDVYYDVKSEVKVDESNAANIFENSEEMVFGLASEAIGIDLNELAEIGNLTDEDISKLSEQEE
ncbi:hypothetical protein [uncultured Kordia sp.]|uniref:lipase family protein n=1 Tax=uncultured Kordia sp. TaxID=507699 RepID=UPI00262B4216|nr:hypothetical protein [uncultured Kordia sp.]